MHSMLLLKLLGPIEFLCLSASKINSAEASKKKIQTKKINKASKWILNKLQVLARKLATKSSLSSGLGGCEGCDGV